MEAKRSSPASGFAGGFVLGFLLGLLLAFLLSPERMRRWAERGRKAVEEAIREGREIAAESEKWF